MELLASLTLMQALYGLLVVLLGYTVLGLCGFGSALVMVPLLGWQWPLATVVPVVLLVDVPASMLYGGLNLQHVVWPEIRRLLLPMLLGAVAGLWLATQAPGIWPLLLLGLYVVAVGVRGLRLSWRPAAQPARAGAGWAPVAGVLIGAIETLFGTAGPPVLMWLARRVPDIHTLRATTPPTMVVAALLALAGMQVSGQVALPALVLPALALAGVALIGVTLGHRLAQNLQPKVIARIIYSLLVLSGLAMTLRALSH